MKKQLFVFAALLCAAMVSAAQTEIELYTTELVCSDDWKGNAVIDKSLLADAAAGDELNVYVSAISTGVQYPQVFLQFVNEAWKWVTFEDPHTYALAGKEVPHVATLPLTQVMLDSIANGRSLVVKGAGYTASKITLTHYTADPEQEDTYITVRTTMWEGEQQMGWSQLCSMASYVGQIVEGDSIYVTVSAKDPDASWPQVRVAWVKGYVNFQCKNDEMPHEYGLLVADTMVTQMAASKKLYLSGTGVTVTKVVLAHKQKVSPERGNAVTTVWKGSQSINWSGTNEWLKVEASALAAVKAGMKLRICFANMKNGAQGHIVDGSWTAMEDANTFEKLPTDWGDYYEYAVTEAMATALKANGLVVSGIGYSVTAVQLVDPEREYLVTATFDKSDIRAWEPNDETPNLSVTFTNYETQEVSTTIEVSMMTDMFTDYNTYSQPVTLAAGETKTVSIEFADLQPGFYRMAAKANDNAICTYVIGYNPTAIVSPDDSQDDFGTFWGNWLDRLAAIPVDAELTLLEGQESDARNIYEVKYLSVPETVDGEPVYIYGYYAEPKAEGKYPCLIHFHGTDKSGKLTMPSATEEGWCEFRFSARGQTLDKAKNGSEKYRTDPENESSVDFYAYGLGDNDKHYYRYVYLDTRRAVDLVRAQAKVDKKNIFAAGGSQGGCLTYVCAALSDGLIRAIAPSITGHADFVHTMEIVGWPTNVFNNWINAEVEAGHYADYEAGKAALLKHQSYFDTKNFAKWISCPVITNFSLQDNTDGPHLNIAPYNLLTQVTDKEYSINPFNGHAAASDWSTTYMAFFNAHIDNTPDTPDTPTSVEAVSNQPSAFSGQRYNMLGQVVEENYKGIVILDGKKYLQK